MIPAHPIFGHHPLGLSLKMDISKKGGPGRDRSILDERITVISALVEFVASKEPYVSIFSGLDLADRTDRRL